MVGVMTTWNGDRHMHELPGGWLCELSVLACVNGWAWYGKTNLRPGPTQVGGLEPSRDAAIERAEDWLESLTRSLTSGARKQRMNP